jgi:hypothetical protein
VTIARRRPSSFTALTAPASPAIESTPLPAPMTVPTTPRDIPAPESVSPVGRLRRCTFRRIDLVSALPGRPQGSTYEIMCLYGGGPAGLALGDVASAQSVCEACQATGIFRPDEA